VRGSKKARSEAIRKYSHVTNEQRDYFLELVNVNFVRLKKAAELAGIKYENAKAINQVYLK
jgi:hypothetical protein